jgi:hypothetical protein
VSIQIKPKRGRPAIRAVTIERQRSEAVLKAASEAWGEILVDDKLTAILASDNFDVANEIYRGHSPNMPHRLILALESASPEHMTIDEIQTAVAEYNGHKSMVLEQRRQGQQSKIEATDKRHADLLSHPKIAPIAAQLKPAGKLTPNGAATRAIEKWQTMPVPTEMLPSRSSLRKIFSLHSAKLLSTQRP